MLIRFSHVVYWLGVGLSVLGLVPAAMFSAAVLNDASEPLGGAIVMALMALTCAATPYVIGRATRYVIEGK
jgi:hypothetical protein